MTRREPPARKLEGNTFVCPHCGSDEGYYVSDRANGWVQYEGVGWTGEEERSNGEDGLSYSRSRTVTCANKECGRRVQRPDSAIRHPDGRGTI